MIGRRNNPDPGREFADIWAQHVVSQRHHRIITYSLGGVLFLLLLVVFRLSNVEAPKPIVIRVDDVGRAEALAYAALEAAADPQDPTTKYFLNQFLSDYYGRRLATIRTAWPRALQFLDRPLSQAAAAAQTDSVARLAAGFRDPERAVESVTLRVLPSPEPPYQATADFDLVVHPPSGASFAEPARERWTASIHFTFLDPVPPALLPINPLGLIITYLEADRAAAF